MRSIYQSTVKQHLYDNTKKINVDKVVLNFLKLSTTLSTYMS